MPATPTTMMRLAMTRFGAVDSVLLGPGTTPRQARQGAVERSLSSDDKLQNVLERP
jgi:hypothetical protein